MLDKDSDVSRIVQRLYQKKLVKRLEGKSDRRYKDIIIKEEGLKLLEEMEVCEGQEDELLSNLNETEIILLNELLDKIRSK